MNKKLRPEVLKEVEREMPRKNMKLVEVPKDLKQPSGLPVKGDVPKKR